MCAELTEMETIPSGIDVRETRQYETLLGLVSIYFQNRPAGTPIEKVVNPDLLHEFDPRAVLAVASDLGFPIAKCFTVYGSLYRANGVWVADPKNEIVPNDYKTRAPTLLEIDELDAFFSPRMKLLRVPPGVPFPVSKPAKSLAEIIGD